MILYNVTITIDPQVEQEWITWMKGVFIPEMMKTECFVEHKFLRLKTDRPDVDGITYAIQYFASNEDQIQFYMENYAHQLGKLHAERFGTRSASFSTLLEEV
ncbi:MAG: DUF4286 family protein [Bacteroidota bacterium]